MGSTALRRVRGPLLGTHVSVAGGVALAVPRAVALGCRAFQIFTRNPNQWRSAPLDVVQVRAFRARVRTAGIERVISHASYLINLAAPADALRAQSIEALADELQRAATLGLFGVVLHPGTRAAGEDEETALRRIARGVREAYAVLPRRTTVRLLFEHTAGQGASVGHRFEHLARLIDLLDGHRRVGVCLDTCHLLAAGYDIASPEGYTRTFGAFRQLVGFERLHAFHVNDSKRPCGSRVDRHAHIGEGHVGIEAFRRLVNDRRFSRLPMLLETEKRPLARPTSLAPDPLDQANLARLRGLQARRAGMLRTSS